MIVHLMVYQLPAPLFPMYQVVPVSEREREMQLIWFYLFSQTVIIVGVIVTVIFLILPVAIPLSICACIVVAVNSTRRNRRQTAYHAVPTSPPDQPTVAVVSTLVNSYQPVNQSFYLTGTHTPSTNPPPYTPGDPTFSPAHPSGDETPAVNPLPTTSNVV